MLTVTDILLEMDPTSVSEGERVTLRCRTKCTVGLNPTYIWYKNRQRLTNTITSYNMICSHYYIISVIHGSTCQCNILISTNLHHLLVAYMLYDLLFVLSSSTPDGPRNTSVSVSPSGEIVEGSSVTLTCSSDANPPVDKSPDIYSDLKGKYCDTFLHQINQENISVSVSPSGEIVEGSSVTLTCSSDANPPVDKYTWYKKNVTSPKASGQSYSITNIISEDRGEYYCEAQNGRGSMNSTALMIIVAGKVTSSILQYKLTGFKLILIIVF
ncbi:B-cell receptor CD22-like [Oncorhynchus nerka]|uniref:B-cell receptor CD22-like n=1 Tax=Oncorhynchus nerka TaxID=8023 RepID=UPI0031B8186D